MANDLVTSDKLISQSVISFGHITKTLQNLTDDANSTKKSLGGVLAKWLKLFAKQLCGILRTKVIKDIFAKWVFTKSEKLY